MKKCMKLVPKYSAFCNILLSYHLFSKVQICVKVLCQNVSNLMNIIFEKATTRTLVASFEKKKEFLI